MKNYYLFTGLILAILFSSCSGLRIEKRHYRNGFYVNLNTNKDRDTEVKNDEPVSGEIVTAESPSEEPAPAVVPAEPVKKANEIIPGSANALPAPEQDAIQEQSGEKNPQVEKQVDKTSAGEPAQPADSDTMLILEIILAIFIPPLAVFLKEGITSRFWLVLILALLGGGFFFYPVFGGLWLVAVILALLIVLDVI